MRLQDVGGVARRRWKTILTVVLLCTIAGIAFSLQQEPEYESRTRLFISTSPSDTNEAYQGGLFATQRVASYADLATGEELAQRVADGLGLRETATDLSDRVRALTSPQTVLLELVVRDATPSGAQRLARAYSEELTRFIAELETPSGQPEASPIKATIVDPASYDSEPVAPNLARDAGVTALLGLLVGSAAAALRDLTDTTVKSASDLDDVGAELPLMGNIVFDSKAARRPLITDLDPHAPRVEAFRVLRTNMQFVGVDGNSKVFVISSSVPAEGKTTTACNLALTLAAAGQRVLLVDGDLRRPRVAEHLGLESSVGLTTVLLGRVTLDEAVQPTGVSNLVVLTSGAMPPNPSELLQSKAMHDLVAELRAGYDTVIIDAPPLLPVTDAALLGNQADGVLLVVRHGKTTKDQLSHALERLANVGARPVGLVLNMMPARGRGDGYYGYGYGYAPEPRGRRRLK